MFSPMVSERQVVAIADKGRAVLTPDVVERRMKILSSAEDAASSEKLVEAMSTGSRKLRDQVAADVGRTALRAVKQRNRTSDTFERQTCANGVQSLQGFVEADGNSDDFHLPSKLKPGQLMRRPSLVFSFQLRDFSFQPFSFSSGPARNKIPNG